MAWRKAGVFDRFMRAITEAYKYSIQMIDSTKVPVHQHAANDHAGL
jgi:transposase